MIKKYKLICKRDYIEPRVFDSTESNTYLFKGNEYDIEEELWGNDIMRRAIIPGDSYVGFLQIPFYDYFYTESEVRDMKLQEIGI